MSNPKYKKVGLIDVDGHSGFPNYALMRLSAWHKQKGDTVEWYDPLFGGHYHLVYKSKIFTFTPDYPHYIDADEVITGGTGYKDYTTVLPEEAEHIFPDYSIYPNCDYAIGFLTRGCIRNCPWCVVPTKEGSISAYDTWEHIKRPDTRRILFMDNNVLASDYGIRQIESMGGQKSIRIDFNQGLDARLIDEPMAKLLVNCKWDSYLRISCDTRSTIEPVKKTIELLKKHGMRAKLIFVYTLIQDIDESYDRIMEIARTGATPFAQPYRDFEGGEPTWLQKRLARWCNHKATFKTVKWEDYTG